MQGQQVWEWKKTVGIRPFENISVYAAWLDYQFLSIRGRKRPLKSLPKLYMMLNVWHPKHRETMIELQGHADRHNVEIADLEFDFSRFEMKW